MVGCTVGLFSPGCVCTSVFLLFIFSTSLFVSQIACVLHIQKSLWLRDLVTEQRENSALDNLQHITYLYFHAARMMLASNGFENFSGHEPGLTILEHD